MSIFKAVVGAEDNVTQGSWSQRENANTGLTACYPVDRVV
jgi:hypothetical protein